MTMTLSGSGTIAGLVAGGLPDATITQPDLAAGVAGNGPAFSAYLGTTQTVSNLTATKLSANTEEFDTNNNYDPSTFRFTPTVAGYYQVNGHINASATTSLARIFVLLYKNGSGIKNGSDYFVSGSRGTLSTLVYMNGTTDYLELYGYLQGTGTLSFTAGGAQDNYFQAFLVRAA